MLLCFSCLAIDSSSTSRKVVLPFSFLKGSSTASDCARQKTQAAQGTRRRRSQQQQRSRCPGRESQQQRRRLSPAFVRRLLLASLAPCKSMRESRSADGVLLHVWESGCCSSSHSRLPLLCTEPGTPASARKQQVWDSNTRLSACLSHASSDLFRK